MNKNKFQKGFTLIELLVVIAIIGILASVLLVNLSSTRNKAKSSAIQLEMNQMRTAMESASNGLTYDTLLTTDGEVTSLTAKIELDNGTATMVLNDSVGAWCAQSALPDGNTWCVDNTGYSGGTNITCDSTNYNCVSP